MQTIILKMPTKIFAEPSRSWSYRRRIQMRWRVQGNLLYHLTVRTCQPIMIFLNFQKENVSMAHWMILADPTVRRPRRFEIVRRRLGKPTGNGATEMGLGSAIMRRKARESMRPWIFARAHAPSWLTQSSTLWTSRD